MCTGRLRVQLLILRKEQKKKSRFSLSLHHLLDPLLAIHPGPQALRDNHRPRLLVPAVLQEGGEHPRNSESSAVDGPGKAADLCGGTGGEAGAEASGLVVGADAGRGDFAPAGVAGDAGGEVGLDVALAGGGGAEVGGGHLEEAAVEAEGADDLGLDVEHLVKDVVGDLLVGGRPGEELDFGELVDAVEALGVEAAGAGLGAVAAGGGDAAEGEGLVAQGGVGLHAGEGNFRGAGEHELGLGAAAGSGGVGGRGAGAAIATAGVRVVGAGDGVDLLLAVLVAGLEAAGGGDVAVYHGRGRDLAPAVAGGDGEGVLGEGVLELGGAVDEVVPAPARGGSGGGEVEDAEFGANVDVGRPAGLAEARGRVVDVAEQAGDVAAGGGVAGEVGHGLGEGLHLVDEAGLGFLDALELDFELAGAAQDDVAVHDGDPVGGRRASRGGGGGGGLVEPREGALGGVGFLAEGPRVGLEFLPLLE